jgi:hypothetical protein
MLASPYDHNVAVRALGLLLFGAAVLVPASAGQPIREGPGIRADIDGDRVPDRLVLTRKADHFTLRVTTRHGATTTRVVRGFSDVKASAMSLPRIVALRPLNGSPGLEIQVLLWYGASHEALVFFTMHRGRLVRMTGAPPRSSDPYVWEMGGTVGTGYETADCIAPYTIGLSGGYPDVRRRWVSTAARYDVRGTRFVRTASYRRVTDEIPNSAPKGWPRLKSRDFKSCGGLVVDRKRR